VARVTEEEVRQLYSLPEATQVSMEPFIEAANLVISMKVSEYSQSGKPAFSDQYLKLLELYLAAHFVVVSVERGGFLSQMIDRSQEQYQEIQARVSTTESLGLARTRFGQQVILLDTGSLLSGLYTKPNKALFRVNH
jgi:hypothetical protein